MIRFTTTLFLLFIFCYISFSQASDQRKLLANHKITAKHTYRTIIKDGQLTSDPVLIYTVNYNSKGYPESSYSFETGKYSSYKSISEYLHATLVLKTTYYKGGDTIVSQRDYQYDSSGNLVQM